MIGIVQRHLKGRDGPLTPEAEAKYLACAQQRFPDHRTMPDGVRAEVDRLVIATVQKYFKRVKDAHSAYTSLSERAALASGFGGPVLGGDFEAY